VPGTNTLAYQEHSSLKSFIALAPGAYLVQFGDPLNLSCPKIFLILLASSNALAYYERVQITPLKKFLILLII
jgi:hypothetical protein